MEGVTKNADILQFGEGSDGESITQLSMITIDSAWGGGSSEMCYPYMFVAGGTVSSPKKCIGTTINWGDFGDGNMALFLGGTITYHNLTGTNLNRRFSELPPFGGRWTEPWLHRIPKPIRLQVWLENCMETWVGRSSIWKQHYQEVIIHGRWFWRYHLFYWYLLRFESCLQT